MTAAVGICRIADASKTEAQISVNIEPAPVCSYGYYEAPPYDCAPYGYYGPERFTGGVFIGAGPWFHGHRGFYGHVDNHFHPDHGYRGSFPGRGERPRRDWHGGRRTSAAMRFTTDAGTSHGAGARTTENQAGSSDIRDPLSGDASLLKSQPRS